MDEDVHPDAFPEQNENPNSSQRFIAHVSVYATDAVIWFTRLGTVLFGFFFLLPMFGLEPESSGSRILITSAIANSLNLHKRARQFHNDGRSFLQVLSSEDSFHFLLYAIIMLISGYVSLITVVPPFLLAVLQITPFTISLLNIISPDSMGLLRSSIRCIDNNRTDILQSVAVIEVLLFPLTILNLFTGKGMLVLPYSYYHYLKSRYKSPRNPYSRRAFSVWRLSLERVAQHEHCPVIVSDGIHRLIEFTIRMSPAVLNLDDQDSDQR